MFFFFTYFACLVSSFKTDNTMQKIENTQNTKDVRKISNKRDFLSLSLYFSQEMKAQQHWFLCIIVISSPSQSTRWPLTVIFTFHKLCFKSLKTYYYCLSLHHYGKYCCWLLFRYKLLHRLIHIYQHTYINQWSVYAYISHLSFWVRVTWS